MAGADFLSLALQESLEVLWSGVGHTKSRRKRRRPCAGLDGGLPLLPRSNAGHGLQGINEDLSIPDFSGPRRAHDRIHDVLERRLADDHLDLDLGDQVDRVLGSAILFLMALLPAEAADLGHREALDARLSERHLYLIQLVRLDDRFDHFHRSSPSVLRPKFDVLNRDLPET